MGDKDLDFESDVSDLEDDEGPAHNSYLKTAHEVDPAEVEKVGPAFKQIKLDELDQINVFGNVCQYIKEGQGIILIMPREPEKIYDLDNIVCMAEDS